MNLRLAIGSTILIASTFTGCGGGDGPQLADVSGIVLLDGKPIANAMVGFYPRSGGRSSHGMTDESGRYELGYTSFKRGAPVGDHVVKIESNVQVGEKPIIQSKKSPKIDAKYNEQSTLTATVNKGNNELNFDLSSK